VGGLWIRKKKGSMNLSHIPRAQFNSKYVLLVLEAAKTFDPAGIHG